LLYNKGAKLERQKLLLSSTEKKIKFKYRLNNLKTGGKMKKSNKKIILTALLIILLISVNISNAFALDDVISPFSVHVHNFTRVVDHIGIADYDNYGHYIATSGYLQCKTCYFSMPFDEEVYEYHTLVRGPLVIGGVLVMHEECTKPGCDYEGDY
jgi:hypothetical protein